MLLDDQTSCIRQLPGGVYRAQNKWEAGCCWIKDFVPCTQGMATFPKQIKRYIRGQADSPGRDNNGVSTFTSRKLTTECRKQVLESKASLQSSFLRCWYSSGVHKDNCPTLRDRLSLNKQCETNKVCRWIFVQAVSPELVCGLGFKTKSPPTHTLQWCPPWENWIHRMNHSCVTHF